jgi:hypothetical protein
MMIILIWCILVGAITIGKSMSERMDLEPGPEIQIIHECVCVCDGS